MTDISSKENLIHAEQAIREEVSRYKLEYGELSPVMRELLGQIYIRGGMEAMKRMQKDVDKFYTISASK